MRRNIKLSEAASKDYLTPVPDTGEYKHNLSDR
jgi:hypothetical protein